MWTHTHTHTAMMKIFSFTEEFMNEFTLDDSKDLAVILHCKLGCPIYGLYECGSPLTALPVHYMALRNGFMIDVVGIWESSVEIAEFWNDCQSTGEDRCEVEVRPVRLEVYADLLEEIRLEISQEL